MLRNIAAAILGYIVMVVIAMAGIGLGWAILGGDGAFAGEGPHPSAPWVTINLLLGLIAAVVGGFTALKVGRSQLAVKILIGIVLVLGLAIALGEQLSTEEPEPPSKPVAEMSFTEAGRYARPPVWYAWIIPLIGAAGVAFGGRDRSRADDRTTAA